ncbi:hypothetical protein [Alicyclobacillus pomorum]|nr:hypothetical protein [Alicyclobacillus pomorum]
MKTKPTGTMVGIVLGGVLLIFLLLWMYFARFGLGLFIGHLTAE